MELQVYKKIDKTGVKKQPLGIDNHNIAGAKCLGNNGWKHEMSSWEARVAH